MTKQQTGSRAGGILAVHAHPDDESITMGATLARYADAGESVTLVTATLGEQGETMYGRKDGLTAEQADQLGGYRLAELESACAAMGVADRRMLGGLGAFRDSGMVGMASAADPRAFIHAQRRGPRHDEAVAALIEVLAEVRPAVILTYDATGGYGHPDHIAAHQVAVDAAAAYGGGAGSGSGADDAGGAGDAGGAAGRDAIRLMEVVRPRAAVAHALERLCTARPVPPRYSRPTIDELGTLTSEDGFDIALAVGPFGEARRRAMAAHATQLDVWQGDPDGFALTNLMAQPLLDAEYFRVLAGPPMPAGAVDLFDGLIRDRRG